MLRVLKGSSRPHIAFSAPSYRYSLQRNASRTPAAMASKTVLSAADLATINLVGYDPEQSRLMDERCILVDDQDRPIGAADKKTCMYYFCLIKYLGSTEAP